MNTNPQDQVVKIDGWWYAHVEGRYFGAYELRGYAEAALSVERRRADNRKIKALASQDRLTEALQIAQDGHASGGGF